MGRTVQIVVTGAAGFIGSHLTKQLLAAGHRVCGIDNFSPFYPRHYKEENLFQLVSEPKFDLVEADIAKVNLSPYLRYTDTVVHLAGRPGVRSCSQADYWRENVVATRALLGACRDADLQRLIFSSTSSLYAPSAAPQLESATPQPRTAYAHTKLLAERYCKEFGAIVLRYFTVYGPRQRPDMAFARFIDAGLHARPAPLYGDGSQVRDFTYIDDVTAGTVQAIEHGRRGSTYNIAGGQPVSLHTALQVLTALLERPVPLQPQPTYRGEQHTLRADLQRAQQELGYRPQTTLNQGLGAQIEAAQERVVDARVPASSAAPY